jgi:Low affinity iron permease
MTDVDRRRAGKVSALMPTDVSHAVGVFDRFASAVASYASRAWFFAAGLILVLIWAPSIAFLDVNTWQLVINTATTIITFLMVALLQNTQTRADAAIQHKLNAIADGLSDLMGQLAEDNPHLRRDLRELRAAVGLENRESA